MRQQPDYVIFYSDDPGDEAARDRRAAPPARVERPGRAAQRPRDRVERKAIDAPVARAGGRHRRTGADPASGTIWRSARWPAARVPVDDAPLTLRRVLWTCALLLRGVARGRVLALRLGAVPFPLASWAKISGGW